MAKSFASITGRAIRTASGKSESRNAMIKAVRAAARRLNLDDADRRALQREVTGRESLGDMTLAEIGKVLDRLNRDYKAPSGNRSYVPKIKALWWSLYWLGAVAEPNDAAIGAFVARQTGKERLQFLGHREAFKVIEALKAWAARSGVAWPDQARLAEIRPHNPAIDLGQLERHAVLSAIAAELRRRGIVHDHIRYLESGGLSCNHWMWTARELDAGIRQLGKQLRRAIERDAGKAGA